MKLEHYAPTDSALPHSLLVGHAARRARPIAASTVAGHERMDQSGEQARQAWTRRHHLLRFA
jgi:hypothetical protein